MKQSEENTIFVKSIIGSLLFAALLILFFAVDHYAKLQLFRYGLYPRLPKGLVGILLSPLIHGSISHLSGNLVPLVILIIYLFNNFPKIAWRVCIWSWIMSGFWVWISARANYHIGASGLVYAFASFLFVAGIISKNRRLQAVSLGVSFLYGALIWGLFPIDPSVSWESHFWGAVAGLILALYYQNHFRTNPELMPWQIMGEEAYLAENIEKYGPLYWDPAKAYNQEAVESNSNHSGSQQVKIHYQFIDAKKE